MSKQDDDLLVIAYMAGAREWRALLTKAVGIIKQLLSDDPGASSVAKEFIDKVGRHFP